MPGLRMIHWPVHTDSERGGSLAAIEHNVLPFIVQRTYYLWGIPQGATRGAHAHIQEQELFVCLRGSVTLLVSEHGEDKHPIVLNDRGEGIYVGTFVWHEFTNFSPDALLLCLSSTSYLPGEQNYITSFSDFQSFST